MNSDSALRPIESFGAEDRGLVLALRDPDPEVRRTGLDTVGEVADDVADELLRLVEADDDVEVRAAAAIALGPSLEVCHWEADENGRLDETDEYNTAPLTQTGYDRVMETLRRVHSGQNTSELVRRRALEAAVRSPRQWQIDAIRTAAASEDPDWRVTAVFCMGFCRLADFSVRIEEAFRSDSEELRHEAIRAAGESGLERLLPEVAAIASDRSAPKSLRYAAVDSLGAMGDAESITLLQELCRSQDKNLAELAEEAVEHIELGLMAGDPDLYPESEW